ncbi:hypothetical protein BG36_09575 [Aquamicrobium defluvii]|uniref:Uncharacterized protein n=1 Tax=Aquamicrobium defluvii TaxID=69279 RepID=A0A011V986_9HYPH|nr:hypothetical protein BG36_09575 [Aquamicrobium defluvii]
MIVACRFEAADHRSAIRLQKFDQTIMLRTAVENRQPATTFMVWSFDENFIARLGDIDCYQHCIGGCKI